jgi:hypothetical protein
MGVLAMQAAQPGVPTLLVQPPKLFLVLVSY